MTLRRSILPAIAALALCASGCTVSLPRNAAGLANTNYRALVVYTNLNIYRFTNYRIREGIISGQSQLYKKGSEILAHGALDESLPPIQRVLGLKDVLRIDAEDDYFEPGFDLALYLAVPTAVALAILLPIVVNGRP